MKPSRVRGVRTTEFWTVPFLGAVLVLMVLLGAPGEAYTGYSALCVATGAYIGGAKVVKAMQERQNASEASIP